MWFGSRYITAVTATVILPNSRVTHAEFSPPRRRRWVTGNWPVKVRDQYLPLRDFESVEDCGTGLGPLKCRYPHAILATLVYHFYDGDDFSLEPQLKSPASRSTNNVFTSSRRADQPGSPSIHLSLLRRARGSKITNNLRHGRAKQTEDRRRGIRQHRTQINEQWNNKTKNNE